MQRISISKTKIKNNFRAGEMAQWLRAQTALPKILSSIPSHHMVVHIHP
jgi:Fic family protein